MTPDDAWINRQKLMSPRSEYYSGVSNASMTFRKFSGKDRLIDRNISGPHEFGGVDTALQRQRVRRAGRVAGLARLIPTANARH
ncbi:hypothetical protein [Micromonospora sp. WMMD975]|uniref:hypothetical protein n=1 Tax=Micromonospora sp. WMMD975 TaxID=3016087 RepID=UPI00249CC959|nr:hypothetical protein [Micromonospora sp. WMMD975]WFE32742.1 hypothetical protein O7613_24790 [Micromonospora sp. WMMD975]